QLSLRPLAHRAQRDLLPGSSTKRNRQPRAHIVLGDVEAVVFGKLRDAEGAAARDDGHLLERIGARQEICDQRMAALMHGYTLLVLVAEPKAAACTQDD